MARRIGIAKQFFRAAVRRGLVDKNPFADLNSVVRENTERDYFLSRGDAEKIIEACSDAQWRLLFALSRYGGLCCPSEHLALKWVDIDWAGSRMRVWSPKTEHHQGQESRIVPIFTELRSYLEEAWTQAEPGAVHVITKYRDATCNLRTQLQRIIKRAGLEPWPKLWQNLRATRATELANEYPAHVAADWLGHNIKIAERHYWRTTEEHFEKAVQNPVQQSTETTGTLANTPTQTTAFSGSFRDVPILYSGR